MLIQTRFTNDVSFYLFVLLLFFGDRISASSNRHSPKVSMNSPGNFILVWEQGENIYARYYDKDIRRGSDVFKVSTTEGENLHPVVAIDDHNTVYIAWENKVNQKFRIYFRCVKNGIQTIGESIDVTKQNIPGNQFRPGIAISQSGALLIVWVDYRHKNPDIYGQFYDSTLNKIGLNFKINDDTTSAIQAFPTVTAAGNKFVVAWEDHRDPYAFIFGQVIAGDGRKIGQNFKVNDTQRGSSWQAFASVALRETGEFIIAWKDYRNGDSDIYAQSFDQNNRKSGNNIRVNDDNGPGWQRLPSIAVNNQGNSIIVWEDYRNDSHRNQTGDIYAQRFDAAFNPIGENFKVNHSPEPSGQMMPASSMDDNNHAVIVWEDHRGGQHPEVFLQYLSDFNMLPNDLELGNN